MKEIYAKVETLLSESENSSYHLSVDEKKQISDQVHKIRSRWDSSKRIEEKKSIELKKRVKTKTKC